MRESNSLVRGGSIALALLGSLAAATAARADQIDTIWIGATGNWSVVGNWNNGVPNNGIDTFNVFIDDGSATASEVFLYTTATIDNLTVDADDVLWINDGTSLLVAGGGTIHNAGTIHLNSTGADTYIQPSDGEITFTGGGVISLSDNANNWIVRTKVGSLVNVDNTIQGAGNLGEYPAATTITNHGTVIANFPANRLICSSGRNGIFTNTGTLRAENGATLLLSGPGGFDNAGGVIEALDGSIVTTGSAVIRGGTLQTSGTGLIEITAYTLLDGSTNQINNTGRIQIPDGAIARAVGTINNTGTIEIGEYTLLHPMEGILTLIGGGTVQMTRGRIYQYGGGSLVNVDNTIQGSGALGLQTEPMAITNQGTIIANTTSLTCNAGTEVFTNSGTLRAENGARLRLAGVGGYDNAGGVIEALDGSLVYVIFAAIRGGTLQTSGSGRIIFYSSARLDGSTNPITVAGRIEFQRGWATFAVGTINNTGTIELGNTTRFHPSEGVLTLTGGGTLEMADNSRCSIYRFGVGSLVNVDNTIRGAGNLGLNDEPMAIDNRGTVIANFPANMLLCTSGSEVFTNSGTLRAENGATLVLNGGSGGFDNAGGVIEARDASSIRVENTTVRGGTFRTSGTGIVSCTTNSRLDGSANAIDIDGLLRIENDQTCFAVGAINNTGTIHLNSTGGFTSLRPDGGVLTLTGGGTVLLTDRSTNQIYQANGGSLVNVDNTIRGGGLLGSSGASTPITNQGTVIADGTVNVLVCGGGAELFDNQGTMRAIGDAGMSIVGSFTTSGSVIVAANSSIERTGAYTQTAGRTIIAGALSATESVDIEGGELSGNGTVTPGSQVGQAVHNSGTVRPGLSIGTLTVTGDFVQDAAGTLAIELGGTTPGLFDVLDVSGSATLDGTLEAEVVQAYTPAVGDRFLILPAADGATGPFAAFSEIGFTGGLLVDAFYDSSGVTLVVVRLADMNCSGTVNALDIEPFLVALFDPDNYPILFPNCEIFNADGNRDGIIDALDIEPFLSCLFGP